MEIVIIIVTMILLLILGCLFFDDTKEIKIILQTIRRINSFVKKHFEKYIKCVKNMIITIKKQKDIKTKDSFVKKHLKSYNLTEDEINQIHYYGKLTPQEIVKEWESLDLCVSSVSNDIASSTVYRCKKFENCHECLLDYASEKREHMSIKDSFKIIFKDENNTISSIRIVNSKCSKCKQEQIIPKYGSVNKFHSILFENILDKSIFEWKCSNCGCSNIDYHPLLFHKLGFQDIQIGYKIRPIRLSQEIKKSPHIGINDICECYDDIDLFIERVKKFV